MGFLQSLANGTPVASNNAQTTVQDIPQGVLFYDDFSSGDFSHSDNGVSWGGQIRNAVTTERPRTGSHSLKMPFLGSGLNQTSIPNAWSESDLNFPPMTELWIKFDMYIPANYFHRARPDGSTVDNHKGVIQLMGTDYSSRLGGAPLIIPQYWRADSVGTSKVSFTGYAYVNGVQKLDYLWGSGTTNAGVIIETDKTAAELAAQIPNRNVFAPDDRGQWISVVMHAKLSGSDNKSGIYELWYTYENGTRVKIIDIPDGPWYSTEYNSTQPSLGWRRARFLGAINGGFNEDTDLFIDNMTVSESSLL